MSKNIIQIPDSIVDNKIKEIENEPETKVVINESGVSQKELKDTVKYVLKSENNNGVKLKITPLTFIPPNYNYGLFFPEERNITNEKLIEHEPLEIPVGIGISVFKAKKSDIRKVFRDIQTSSNEQLNSYKTIINNLETIDNTDKKIL